MTARRSTARKPARKPTPQSTAPATTIPDDGYMSRAQAAEFCGVNIQIIDSAIDRGQLRAFKVQGRDVKVKATGRVYTPEPRRVLIAVRDLHAWATARQV